DKSNVIDELKIVPKKYSYIKGSFISKIYPVVIASVNFLASCSISSRVSERDRKNCLKKLLRYNISSIELQVRIFLSIISIFVSILLHNSLSLFLSAIQSILLIV